MALLVSEVVAEVLYCQRGIILALKALTQRRSVVLLFAELEW